MFLSIHNNLYIKNILYEYKILNNIKILKYFGAILN